MKKLMVISVLGVFALGMLAQTTLAFGDCSGKTKHTKITDTTSSETDKS